MKTMRKQYFFRRSPKGLLAWDVDRLVKLSQDLPRKHVRIEDLGELDHPWSGDGDAQTWREMIAHIKLIDACDLSFPIILSAGGEVMDGRHRIAKAALLGVQTIECVQFSEDPKPDHIGKRPEELPY
jgi:hypothetical protein